MIDVIVEEAGWEKALPDCTALAAEVHEAIMRVEPSAKAEIALLMANAEKLRDLNVRFRHIDKPTNVLSFPSGETEFLGDIALAYEVCRDEAAEKNIALRDHAAHLIVHGILHLLGYDHIRSDEAAVMEERETEILRTMGISDPYADTLEQV